jgi:hypothetical protein
MAAAGPSPPELHSLKKIATNRFQFYHFLCFVVRARWDADGIGFSGFCSFVALLELKMGSKS